jgi:hypothetical protein
MTRTPDLGVVLCRSVAGRTGRLDLFHSYFYTNPRLQARVVPARFEMVTTLIAQMSDLLANIQIYDARVVEL